MSAKRGRRSIPLTLARSLRLRCPACGRATIVERPFQIKHHCPACRALFKREEGFFVGAIVANVLTTELVVLATYFALIALASAHFDLLLAILLAVAVLFPVAFYHHSWSLWLGADYVIESLPVYTERGRVVEDGDDRARGNGRGESKP
ncbi:MAG: DUF983 domain-containing protein [Acidobacteria bacterium]|nr:DUF983 domain-containing protein [Acidobacteriota bacterium]